MPINTPSPSVIDILSNPQEYVSPKSRQYLNHMSVRYSRDVFVENVNREMTALLPWVYSNGWSDCRLVFEKRKGAPFTKNGDMVLSRYSYDLFDKLNRLVLESSKSTGAPADGFTGPEMYAIITGLENVSFLQRKKLPYGLETFKSGKFWQVSSIDGIWEYIYKHDEQEF